MDFVVSDSECCNAVSAAEVKLASSVHNENSIPTMAIKDEVSPETSYHQFLKNHFGHNNFRNGQLEIIRSIINDQRDNLAIMSTGQGKSLCYQFPALWTGGLTIVISPLISLMIDQVTSMNNANIPATFLGSAQINSNEIRQRLIETNFYRLLYVCPEFIMRNKSLITQLKDKLTLIAIDEVHCVSHWGHDFRPEYQQLGELRSLAPHVPIFATTATATECVQKEICSSLFLNNPLVTCTGFDRPNLELCLRTKPGFLDVVRKLARTVDGSIIVYCFTRSECEEFTETLQKENIECEFYHAGLSKENRSEIQNRFRNDVVKLIFATCAFGMGIDKPNVRYVLHYGATRSIESYYQEVGRAGRDGAKSKSILFYSRKDVVFNMYGMRDKNVYDKASSYGQRSRQWLVSYMEQFLLSQRCRRLNILQYFQGLSVTCATRSDCCDNCESGSSSKYTYRYRNMDECGFFDFTKDTRCLMSCIKSFPNGMSRDPKNFRNQKGLNHHDENYWDGLADILERHMYLKCFFRIVPGRVNETIVELSDQGLSWFNDKTEVIKVQLQPFDKLTRYVEIKELTNASGQHTESKMTNQIGIDRSLYEKLLITRNTLADFLNIPHVAIATDSVVSDIAARKPMSISQLRNEKFQDFTDLKIEKYGRSFVNCIMDHQTKNATAQQATSERRMVELIKNYPYPDDKFNHKITREHLTLMNLIEEKHSIEVVRLKMCCSQTSIVHLSIALLQAGYLITKHDLKRLFAVDEKTFCTILSRLPRNLFGSNTINLVKSELFYYSRDTIQLVLSYRIPRVHLTNLGVCYDDPDIIPYAAEQFVPADLSTMRCLIWPLYENKPPLEYYNSTEDEEDSNNETSSESDQPPFEYCNSTEDEETSNNETSSDSDADSECAEYDHSVVKTEPRETKEPGNHEQNQYHDKSVGWNDYNENSIDDDHLFYSLA